MGKRRFRLSVQRKNHERKRWGFFPVCIPIKGGISVFKVSIPLSVLSESCRSHMKTQTSPETEQTSSNCTMFEIKRSLETMTFPSGWFMAAHQEDSPPLALCCMDHQAAYLKYTLHVHSDFSWTLLVHGITVQRDQSPPLANLPDMVNSAAGVVKVLELLSGYNICEGNSDETFLTLSRARGGQFIDASGCTVAREESHFLRHPTIRHVCCETFLTKATISNRCHQCTLYRKKLHSLLTKHKATSSTDRTAPCSHVNYRFLNNGEMQERMKRLHQELRCYHLKSDRLKQKLLKEIEERGETLDDGAHADLQQIMKDCSSDVAREYPEGSFQRLFWDQQQKAAALKDARSMRWHPLVIKWCLYLRHVSSRAYETVRSFGCIRLPSQRTLRDYTHCVSASQGFNTEVDNQLASAVDIYKCTEREKYVTLVVDEMHIKEGLVFSKHSGALIGFTNLGEVNNHLLHYHKTLETSSTASLAPLAKTMIVIMVRGLFSDIEFPYAQFSCDKVTGDLMFNPMWEAINRIELIGLKVMAVTADGASTNRRLFRIHDLSSPEMPYRVINPYSMDRYLYFVCDVPHLMKTVRNGLANSKRALWCDGHELQWSHIVDLYHRNKGAKQNAPGLCLVPKLTYEHIRLTPFSKMRVDLAVQVLSQSVAKALSLTGGEETQGTAHFVEMFDKFFDCLNVASFSAGKNNRKPFQSPYRSPTDFRIKWLEEEFIPYLNRWEESVKARPGFSQAEKKMMLLSEETRMGLRTTVKSFVALLKFAFTIPGVTTFLSEKLCRDPLEQFFGCQRQRGRVNENPTVHEFCTNTQALKVVNTFCRDVSRQCCATNCRGSKRARPIDWEKENKPLPKRRRPSH